MPSQHGRGRSSGRPDDQRATASSPEGHETQSCMRPREVGIIELIRGRRVASAAIRGTPSHQHIKCGHTQHLAASRRENSSTEGLQQHPERMTRACAVSIMNACLHELVWVVRASCESAWRLESTTQQQWCTGYEPGGCCCSHPSSARERLVSRRWTGTSCSPARRRSETALAAIPRQRRDRGIAGVYACSRRTVASASVPRRGTGKNRWIFPVHSHLRLDPAV